MAVVDFFREGVDVLREGARSAAICGGALAGLASVWGCSEREGGTGRPAPSATVAIGIARPGSAAPGSAAPQAPTLPSESKGAPLEGTWEGPYQAERASPTLAPTVKDRAWARDDGKRASGQGLLRIVVGRDGEVGGSVEGPLGPADLVGFAEETRLVATVVPRGETSFAGLVEATVRGDALEVVLRASDGTAETVRSGKASLHRSTKPH